MSEVPCTRCKSWEDEDRKDRWCKGCANTKMTTDPKEILCNLCGGCMRQLGTYSEQYGCGLENAVVQGGYDSYHLLDMNTYKFSFCEKCLRKLFMQCKISPTVFDANLPNGNYTFADDQESYEYRVWKDAGGHHQAYLNHKCNAIKDCPNNAVYTLLHNSIDFTESCFCEEHKEWRHTNSSLVPFIRHELKPFL